MLSRTDVVNGPLIERLTLVDGDAFSLDIEVVVNPGHRDHYLIFKPHMGDSATYEVELTDDELDVLARKLRTFRYAQA